MGSWFLMFANDFVQIIEAIVKYAEAIQSLISLFTGGGTA